MNVLPILAEAPIDRRAAIKLGEGRMTRIISGQLIERTMAFGPDVPSNQEWEILGKLQEQAQFEDEARSLGATAIQAA